MFNLVSHRNPGLFFLFPHSINMCSKQNQLLVLFRDDSLETSHSDSHWSIKNKDSTGSPEAGTIYIVNHSWSPQYISGTITNMTQAFFCLVGQLVVSFYFISWLFWVQSEHSFGGNVYKRAKDLPD